VGVAARVVVGLVLLAAGAFKLRDVHWPADAAAFGLPAALPRPLATAEVVLGALLIAQVGGRVTSTVAAALLGAFTVAVTVHVARGDAVPCACFGSRSGGAPVSGRTVARNAVLLALAVVGALVQ
jgi:uncharacterized membrane protein YphA (DoxX/SURF4 family)